MPSTSAMFVTTRFTILLFGALSSIASGANGNGSSPNGKPFVELDGQLVAVEGAISDMQTQINELIGRVDTMEERLTKGESGIATLDANIIALQGLINDGLAATRETLDAEILNLEGVDESLRQSIQKAILDAESQNSDTVDYIAGIEAQIDNNVAMIEALQSDIVDINTMLEMKQMIIDGRCPDGQAIQEIDEDGGVVCQIVDPNPSVSQFRVYGFKSGYYGATASATCPEGFILTGGGHSTYMPYGGHSSSRPSLTKGVPGGESSRTWQGYVRVYSGGSYWTSYVYTYAVCLRFN